MENESERTCRAPIAVGRVTPCAPRLQPAGATFSRGRLPTGGSQSRGWTAGRLVFLALAGAMFALAQPTSAREFYVFIGTYTNASSQGIYVSRLDAATGRLAAPALAAATPSPCYLAVSPDQKFVYAANSVRDFSDDAVTNGGAVSAFAMDAASGKLALLNQKCSGGMGPCHVSLDASGRVLLAANYGDGRVRAFLLETNGAIGPAGDGVRRTGSGPNPGRQASAHAHYIHVDPSNRFALVCDLGTDGVAVYPLEVRNAGLQPSRARDFPVPPGAGARHLAFSPDGKYAHVINEMACTVTTFAWDSGPGRLELVGTVSALPPGVGAQPGFTAAEILAAGHFIYASIRGHDSISVFAADAATGRLTFVQTVASGGKVPRGLGIDPTGRWLLAGNQNSDAVVEFAIDPVTGRLSATGQALKIGSPVDVKFASPDRN